MLKYYKGQKISLNLTLVNNDGNPEDDADISYSIYDTDNNEVLSNNDVPFNEQLGSYIDVIDPWDNQEEGIYYINWIIENTTEDYPNTATEVLYIENYNENLDNIYDDTQNIITDLDSKGEKLDKILGLLHQNIYIDETEYDNYENLIKAKIRIYSDSSSVGSDSNILATYRIYCEGDGMGKFTYWSQVEE